MIVTVRNTTPYLNDYHFKSLCLLYFPEEKFPADDQSGYSASFLLEETPRGLHAAVCLAYPGGKAESACFEDSLHPSPAFADSPRSEFAQAVAGVAFLECGKALFGFVPPWGFLIGLRPVKRARYYLARGWSEEDVKSLFVNDYKVSEEKADLSLATARREIALLSPVRPNECGLYLSVPFCPTRCDYCSFVSYANKKLFDLIPAYLERVCTDIARTGLLLRSLGMHVSAVYVGGGTPSILTEPQLELLLSAVNTHIDLASCHEFSFEAGRPDTITKEKLKLLRTFGIDRISINPQTTCQRVLDAIGRRHSVEQFFHAAELSSGLGFRVRNADLIAGLPSDTDEDFDRSVSDVLALGFENITLHTLCIKNAAELKKDDSVFDAAGNFTRGCVSRADARLADIGYQPYYLYRQKRTVGNAENTGFALPGTENLYNVLMMEEHASVFSCGAGAITKLVSDDKTKIERIAFAKYPFEYLASPAGIGEEKIQRFFMGGPDA